MPETRAGADAGALRKQIEERAYALWEGEGRPEGRALDHWLRAEAESAAGSSTESGAEAQRNRKKAEKA
jgi:hypothetical protein